MAEWSEGRQHKQLVVVAARVCTHEKFQSSNSYYPALFLSKIMLEITQRVARADRKWNANSWRTRKARFNLPIFLRQSTRQPRRQDLLPS